MHCNPLLIMKAEQDKLRRLAQKQKAIARLIEMNEGFPPASPDVLLRQALELLGIVNVVSVDDFKGRVESAYVESR